MKNDQALFSLERFNTKKIKYLKTVVATSSTLAIFCILFAGLFFIFRHGDWSCELNFLSSQTLFSAQEIITEVYGVLHHYECMFCRL